MSEPDDHVAGKMNELERQLKATRTVAKSAADAELFYRCGFAAAQARESRSSTPSPPFSWQAFSTGAASGIAVALMLVAGWYNMAPESHVAEGETDRPAEQFTPLQVNENAIANSVEEPQESLPTLQPLNLASWVKDQWPSIPEASQRTDKQAAALSPAANQQWLSLIENEPMHEPVRVDDDATPTSPLPHRGKSLDPKSIPDVL